MTTPNVLLKTQNAGRLVDRRTIRRRTEKVLSHLDLNETTVSILLCNDHFIRELNRTYRGKDQPTDVLSFAMREGDPLEGDTDLLGDVIISIETAERQAPKLNHSVTDEVTSLMIHGVLHLLGYDHMRPEDETEMQKQAGILEALFKRTK